jgi:DNA-binding NtrC family response regulator
VRRSLQILVQREGFEAIESSGADILSGSWKYGSPDLIVSYVDGENAEEGLEVIRRIRRRDLQVPIILITSSSSKEIAAKAHRIGISNYLKLPVSPQDLVSSINRSLSLPRLIPGADGRQLHRANQ